MDKSITPDNIGPPEKSNKNLSVLNIGQILILAVLFTIICLQAVDILFAPAQQAEPLRLEPGITQNLPEIQPAPVNQAEIQEEPVAEAIPPSEPEIIFILGESSGRLAILSPDGQTVHEIYNVYINTLPEYDRNLLIEGIKIKTPEELASLLEDFSS